jgi:thaumarchaeosortase
MGSLKKRLPFELKTADALLALSAIPVLFLLVLAPDTFGLSWAGFGKLGRGGLLFVLFFLWFELLDFRKVAKPHVTRTRKAAIAILFALALTYFGGLGLAGQFTDFIYSIGRNLGASGDVSNSFLMATDYLVLTLYIAGLAAAFFSARAVLGIFTAIVFSAGMLIMYLLDAFFPYGSLGPLQFWADFIVAGVGFLSSGFGLPIYGFNNVLTILGKHGTYQLIVFWPSVGVHSMLIYSLVMVLLAARLAAPASRKIMYAIAGVGGTVFLNVTRIFLIAYYGYEYAVSGADLDAFHNSIGEFLFPIWIVVFLLIVLNIEGRLQAKARRTMLERERAPTTMPDHEDKTLPHPTTTGIRSA